MGRNGFHMGSSSDTAMVAIMIALIAFPVGVIGWVMPIQKSTAHSHNLITGIWSANNGTQNCTSSTTTFVLCSDLSQGSWGCTGISCGFSMNTNSTQGFPDTLFCIATFLYSFSAAV